MSTEAVGAIWIGGAALNSVLIWTSVCLSRLLGHDDGDGVAAPEPDAGEVRQADAPT
jgi:hypothetical protein